jgi:hypothetical protein
MPLNQNSYYTSSNNKSQQLSERPYFSVGIVEQRITQPELLLYIK